MTLRDSNIQKQKELHFVECAARLLEVEWQAEARECPDFIVTCGDESFALEVTEIQSGSKNRKGSTEKKVEAANTKWLNSIRTAFDPNSAIPLDLKFLGMACPAAKFAILEALKAEQFDQRPILHRMTVSFPSGERLWATKAMRHHWQFMRDIVGWVSQDLRYLHDAISRKSHKIAGYKKAHNDVRLLVVANRLANSGKILLENGCRANLHGFSAVYFLSYPTSVMQVLPLES